MADLTIKPAAPGSLVGMKMKDVGSLKNPVTPPSIGSSPIASVDATPLWTGGPGNPDDMPFWGWFNGDNQTKIIEKVAAKQGEVLTQTGKDLADAFRYGADKQSEAANNAIGVYKGIHDQTRTDFTPYRERGIQANDELYGMKPFSFDPNDVYKDPGYTFRLNEGLKGIDRQMAARGIYGSNHLNAATRFNQDYASNEVNNLYNRSRQMYLDNQNRLNTLADRGLNAAGQTAASGSTYASNTGNAMIGAGNAQSQGVANSANALAQGQIGASNAWGQGQIAGGNAKSSAYGNIANNLMSILKPFMPLPY